MIDKVQTSFIEGRSILGGPLIINEIYTWAKQNKNKLFIFKVYFNKAFDSINQNYLKSVMNQMGVGDKWIFWIKGCLSSSRASVLINGSVTKEFPITKGVRQGGPLSTFLFIIAMEDLNIVMRTTCQKIFSMELKFL